MKIFTSLFFLLLALTSLSAQQDLKLPGLVVEQNSKYRTGKVNYLSNVEIKSAGAIPQRSDAEGKFTLVFADRPGGDVARIFASKSGYEVVNEVELKQASVIGRIAPLKIVMCIQDQLYRNQLAYYNIAKDASLAAYERKVATLNKAGKEQERLIAELRVQFNLDLKTKEEALALLDKQRQQSEKQAKELADKWVTVNLDDQSPNYQRAFAAFEAKNIELAKAILDSVDLEQRLALNSSQKAKEQALLDTLQKNILLRETEMQQDVNMCLFNARLHKLDYEWAEAERLYDLAVQYDKGNYEVTFEAAHFMQSQNQFPKARKYYEKALSETLEKDNKATILNNLGILLSDNNDMSGAKSAYEEALQISRQLAAKNPDIYLQDVAETLNNLGNLLYVNNDMSGAKNAYEEALHIFRQLVTKNPEVNLPNLATTLTSLGVWLKDNNDMPGAKSAYEEALQIRRQLAGNKPDVYLRDVAGTLINLGVLLDINNDLSGAKSAYEEALQIRRQLAAKNPDAYLPDIAVSLNNLGVLLEVNNDISGAQSAFEEALQITRQLAAKNPDAYLPHVAMTLNNLGGLIYFKNRMPGTKSTLEEALQIYRLLAAKNPEVYLPDVVMTLNNLGLWLKDNNDMSGSRSAFDEALQIIRQLAAKNPDVYLHDLATILNSLGDLLYVNNDMPGAKTAFDEALKIRRQLADKNPDTYNLFAAMTDINVGLLYEQLLKTTGDMSLKSAGLELAKDANQRLSIFPENHPGVQEYRPYIEHLSTFFQEFDARDYQLSHRMNPIIQLEKENESEKDPHQKVIRQEEVIKMLFEIEKDMPDKKEVANLIASKYASLAWYQLFDKQFAAAEQSAHKGLEKAPAEEWINANLALALLFQGKWEAARQIYTGLKDKKYGMGTYKDAFLEDLQALEKAGIAHPDMAKARHLLENE